MDLRTGTILGPAAPPKAATEIILGGPGDLKKGYRYTEEGAEYVPGGSEDPEVIAAQEEAKRRAALAVENEEKLPGRRSGIYADHLNAPTFATSVQRAIDLAGSAFSSGMAQQALDKFAFPTILGMELGAGFDLQSALSAVKANVGFDELIRIKEAGGTLGALSELENKLLQAMQGVLIAEEDADVLIPALKKVQQIYNLNLQQKKDEFKRIYGEDVRRPWEPPPDSGITQQEWDAIIADEPPPDSGITQQEWDEMTPEQKKAF